MATEKVICDTDVIIDYYDKKNIRHLATRYIVDNSILSAVSKTELLTGATNKEDLERINREIAHFHIAQIDTEISKCSLSLLQQFSLSHGLAIADSLIAATSIILDYQLFTYNIKDYKFIDKIRLYKFKMKL